MMGGDVTNVQCKSNWNCHYESSLYNEFILIKIYLKKDMEMGMLLTQKPPMELMMHKLYLGLFYAPTQEKTLNLQDLGDSVRIITD
jgi:hypothetical protein